MKPFPTLAVLTLAIAACIAAPAQAETTRSLVFDKGMCGSKYYRIPAIAVASDGSLVAVADRRWDSLSDLPGRIDVVGRRSTDGGVTWGDVFTVAAADTGGGYGDPALGTDPKTGDLVCIMTHGNGLWESTPDDHAAIMISRSGDCGLTWSVPQPIVMKDADRNGGDFGIEGYIGGFATSGAIGTADDGRLMFVLVARTNPKKWSSLSSYALWSSDGGYTWEIAEHPADTDGDESKIVETADGRLLMSIRNRRKGARKFSESTDGGRTWTEPRRADDIVEPGCNGDIIRYRALKGAANPLFADGTLLQTVPADPKERRNVTLYASDDNGATWREVRTICPAPSSYSSMTELPDGSLAILTEEAASDGGWRLWLTKIGAE